MKLLILLTVVACLQVTARGYSQTVTLSFENAPLEKVFKEIKKQTGYSFIYTRAQLKNTRPVSANIIKTELKEALSFCFRNQPLSFIIEGNYIVVQTKITITQTSIASDTLIDIRGHVVNENGEPIAGASVIAKNSNRGVSTNNKGDFLLQGVKQDDILQISSVGFYKEEIPVNNQRFIFIKLRLAMNSLEEMIIKGYYATSKRLNTGSVVKINGEQITDQPVSNPILALEGVVPGLTVTQTNGLPGSRFKALIRGQSSIQNGNSPLFIIDGVPFLSDNDALTQLNGMLANSPFNSLDPNDIESIEILKDADATAIYGSRGANGVILITTKKSKADRNSFSLNVSSGWGKVTRTMKLMNTQEYLEMRKEAFTNDGVTPDNINAPDLVSWSQNRYTNWQKLFIGGTARTYNAQLRYSGGNQFTKFSFGGGYYKETTVFPGEFGERKLNTDINVNHKSADNKLILSFISSYSFNKSQLPGQDLTTYVSLPPNSYDLKESSGKFIWSEAGYSVGNPLAILLQKNNIITERLTANGTVAYKPITALEFKANFGYNKVSADERIIAPLSSFDPAYAPTGSSVFGDNFIRTWIIEPQASYRIKLKSKFRMDALLGSTFQKSESQRKLITGSGYTNDELLGSIAAAPYITATNSKSQYHYGAMFGRLGFDWDNKYLLNLTGRRDGSSRFGPDERFANFFAIGVAWIITNEKFFKKALPFMSFGKIRGSYGTTGNDQIGNYQYLDTYRGTIFSYQGQPGLTPSRLFNSRYSWEENKKLELAAEFGFFQDKLSVTFNYYKNKSDNQIIRYSLPTQTGFTDVLLNFPGIVQNKGFEISLAVEIIKNKKFQWNAGFNVSRNKNKLIDFPGLENSSYNSTYVIGKPLNAFRGLHFIGVEGQMGIYQFQDINNDGLVNSADFLYTGTTDPKFYGGFSNKLQLKGFQLNILFEFRRQLGLHAIYSFSGTLGAIQNQATDALNHWRKPGDIVPYEKYTQQFGSTAYLASNNISQSDAILTDASYIRLKNIVLSYDIPLRHLRIKGISSWKFFMQAQNLFTITGYQGYDPENQSITSLPPLRLITIGTQLNF